MKTGKSMKRLDVARYELNEDVDVELDFTRRTARFSREYCKDLVLRFDDVLSVAKVARQNMEDECPVG